MNVWNQIRLFTWWPMVMAMAMATVKLHVCVFFSIAIAITKWVSNPFTNDAIALAVGHHVNSLNSFHATHS